MRNFGERFKSVVADPMVQTAGVVIVLGLVLVGVIVFGGSDETDSSSVEVIPDSEFADELIPRSEEQEAVVPVTREVEDTTPVPIAERRLWTNRGSRILKVRKGRKVKLHSSPRGKVVAQVRAKTDFGSPRTMAVLEREGEWIQVSSSEAKDNRPLWVRASYKDFIFQTTPMKIMVNLGDREVRLIDGSKQVAKFPVTIGAGGTSTPPGRFGVTDVFTGGLNPAYGCCAIALSAHQPNLPPGWIGGDRVAIHGTTGPVGGAESSGCIRATNPNAMKLVNKVPLGTPVIVVS